MPHVAVVTVLALLQFFWLALQVAFARTRYGVAAPATTGNQIFERYFRIQMNTLEQLVLFLPVLWIFAAFISPPWAAGFGVVFIIGRAVYAAAYVRDPKSRTVGFALTALPTIGMMAWILFWAVRAIAIGATQ